MEEARLRALKHFSSYSITVANFCRNGRSPVEGIETNLFLRVSEFWVEMEEARLRALKLVLILFIFIIFFP